jgi:hypothetical protein
MSAITNSATSSGLSAIAQLLANSANTATAVTSQTGSSAPAAASSNPSDSLDLSDHAKATLAQAQQQQIAADNLQAFLQSARNPNGAGKSPSPSQSAGQASDDVTKIFDQLTGQTQAPTQTQGPAQAQQTYYAPNQSLDDFFTAQFTALKANARQPDGTIGNYSETFNDISFAPTTPEAINNWYQNDGQAAVQGAPQIAQQAPGSPQAIQEASLAQAVENHTVTLLNAFNIPGLDFHNSLTIQGGEDGGGNSWTVTYNHDAAIFNDPTTNYEIGGDGTVISWKNPAPSGAASS